MIRRFVIDVCGARPDWTPASIITQSVERIRKQVGTARVLSAVSGGVDSSVATALVQQAVGDQLAAVFVDTGLLRQGERQQVAAAFERDLEMRLLTVDVSQEILHYLQGVVDPEKKRRILGEAFIRTFEEQAHRLGSPHYLVQVTIYPDVVESSAPDR